MWSKLSSRHSQQVTIDQWMQVRTHVCVTDMHKEFTSILLLYAHTQTWVDPILETLLSCSASHQAHIAQVSSVLTLGDSDIYSGR